MALSYMHMFSHQLDYTKSYKRCELVHDLCHLLRQQT